MEINERVIPHIERALGVILYDNQKTYLLGKGSLACGRKTGKTFAYCIKLSLSDGEPLNLRKPEEFSDEWSLTKHTTYSRTFFRREFIRIRRLLETYGFQVRKVRK